MQRLGLVILAAVLTVAFGSGSFAQQQKKAVTPRTEKVAIPPEGATKFTVTGRGTFFRLTVSTIAGGEIEEPKVEGTVALVRTSEISRINEEGMPAIGAIVREYTFRGMGAGKSTITITKKVPTSPMPVVEKFEVTIK